MSASDPSLSQQRAARDAARATFRQRLDQAKIDLAPATLKRRIASEVQQASVSAASQALEIANDNRGIVIATLAALLLWVGRKPVFAGAQVLVRKVVPGRRQPQLRWPDGLKPAQIQKSAAHYWGKLKGLPT